MKTHVLLKIIFALLLAAATTLKHKSATHQGPYESWCPSRGRSRTFFARLVGDRLSAALGQPVVIENRAGAGRQHRRRRGREERADGYTLLMATTGVMRSTTPSTRA